MSANCVRAKREQLKGLYGLLPESQGQNLALTVLWVPCLLNCPPHTPHSDIEFTVDVIDSDIEFTVHVIEFTVHVILQHV